MATTTPSLDGPLPSEATFSPGLVRKLIQYHHKQSSKESDNNNSINHHNDPNNNDAITTRAAAAATTNRNKRITQEATLAAGELLRLFVLEVRQRASILAECEQEAQMLENDNDNDDDDDAVLSLQPDTNHRNDRAHGNQAMRARKKQQVEIRSDHITQVAAEVLMDFS